MTMTQTLLEFDTQKLKQELWETFQHKSNVDKNPSLMDTWIHMRQAQGHHTYLDHFDTLFYACAEAVQKGNTNCTAQTGGLQVRMWTTDLHHSGVAEVRAEVVVTNHRYASVKLS